MKDGKKLKKADPILQQQADTLAQMRKLPSEVLNFKAQKGVYPVDLSKGMLDRIAAIKAKYLEHKKKRIGWVFASLNPPTESHKLMVERAKMLYDLDEVIVVVTGDKPVHHKEYMFDAELRAAMAKKLFENSPGITIDTTEVEGKSAYTTDTMKLIKEARKFDPDKTENFMIGGDDLFETLWDKDKAAPGWKDAQALLDNNNWIVLRRTGNGTLPKIGPLMKDYKAMGQKPVSSKKHFIGPKGNFVHLVDLRTGDLSSTQAREDIMSSDQEMDTIAHQVDTQITFWEALMNSPKGTLAVPGSEAITKNVERLAKFFKKNRRVKKVSTKDFHHEIELEQPDKWNPEFKIFGAHGMAKRGANADGHERISGVEVFDKAHILEVPNFNEVVDASGERVLQDAEFDFDANRAKIMDPDTELLMHKNGARKEGDGLRTTRREARKTKVGDVIQAYDWGINNKAEALVQMINPKRVIVYGVATDWCVVAAVMRYVDMGYEVWVVEDAIAGIFPERDEKIFPSTISNIKDAKEAMLQAGVKFKTTAEVILEYSYKTVDETSSSSSCASNLKAASAK